MVILLGDEGKVKRCNTTWQHFLCLSLTPFVYGIRLWSFVLLLLLSFILPSFVGFCCGCCYLFDYWFRYWGILLHSAVPSQVNLTLKIVVVVQSLSCVWLIGASWTVTHPSPMPSTISWSLITFMSIESVMLSSHLILCCPLFLLPSVLPRFRIFSNELTLWIRWPKYWSFSFSNSPADEYWGWVSFRIDWLDLLAVQGTLKSLFRHHCLKASILWHSVLFMVQLSHLYMTTGKTIALTIWAFVGKVMSLLLNTLALQVAQVVKNLPANTG